MGNEAHKGLDIRSANQLVDAVRDNPNAVMGETRNLLATDLPPTVRSIVLRACGLAARAAATMSESVELLRESVQTAERVGRMDMAADSTLSLAGSLALAGELQAALQTLDLSRELSSEQRAQYEFQRASIYARSGESNKALSALDAVLPLFRMQSNIQFEAFTLANRGRLRLETVDLDGAEGDLLFAADLHTKMGNDVSVAYINHNLGEIAACRGDIVTALRRLEESAAVLERLTTTSWEPQATQVGVLISAGLFNEADRLAERLVDLMAGSGLELDRGEALLMRARAQLSLDDAAAAEATAGRAASVFIEQGRMTWAQKAEVLKLRSASVPIKNEVQLGLRSFELARRLDEAQSNPIAAEARAEGVIRVCRGGRPDLAVGQLKILTDNQALGWVERRFFGLFARAYYFATVTDRAAAFRAIHSAFKLANRHRLSLGASELMAGVSVHLSSLEDLALQLALQVDDPRRVFDWVERTRAVTLGIRPIQPPADPVVANLLGEVRSLGLQLPAADLDQRQHLARQHAKAVRSLRHRERLRQPESRSGDLPQPSLAAVRAKLPSYEAQPSPPPVDQDPGSGCFVSMFVVDGRLRAQVVGSRKTRLIDLGDFPDWCTEFDIIRRRLDGMARGLRSGKEALRRSRKDLEARLIDELDEQPAFVLAPPVSLFDAPWGVLRPFAERPLVVTPSAALWARAAKNPKPLTSASFIAGPDLSMADREVAACSSLYEKTKVIQGKAATAATVLEVLKTKDLVHLVCHGRHRVGNASLSSLSLYDGALLMLELEGIQSMPSCVVLSACGAATIDPIGRSEMLGITTTFLRFGADAVIAGNGLVQDSEQTVEFMVRMHRGLVAGLRPEEAVLKARTSNRDENPLLAGAFHVYGTRNFPVSDQT